MINRTLARRLIRQYGYKKGKHIYFEMVKDNTPSFRKGLETAKREGHVLKHFPRK